jgi:histidine triad (HIT) family protein
MSSIFSKIISGEIPCFKIAENEHCFAFLDIQPLMKGHTLVIPKTEVDYLFDLGDDVYQDLMTFSKRISKAIKKAIPCNRIGVAVIGLEVPHAHIHLVPINQMDDINFTRPKLSLSIQEFEEIAASIRNAIV